MEYTSAKCSVQVENELRETFSRLEHAATEATSEISGEIDDLDGEFGNIKQQTHP